MTNLTRQVTRTGGRIEKWMVVAAAAALLAGCDNDRTNNANAREPVAITQSGIEILSVTRRMDERTVEAVIVAGGEERQVTMEPLLDGPLPSGFRASLDGETGIAYGWDERSGALWFEQQSGDDHFAMLRMVANGRVSEEYAFNDRTLRLDYADLPAPINDKAANKYVAGESLDGASPEVVELGGVFSAFEAFAAELPDNLTSSDHELLTSLLADPVFASEIVGEDIDPNRPDGICRFFNVCAAISCKLIGQIQLCTVCAAGSLACLFMDWFCYAWCHSGG